MADAIVQHRIDALQEHMDAHGITENIVQIMAPDEGLEADSLGELCDPLAYYGDQSQMTIKAGVNPTLPPVPTTLADLGVGGPSIWAITAVPRRLRSADTATIAKIAEMVAVSFCDQGFKHVDRSTSLRYILINNCSHPASKILAGSSLWEGYRRSISIPDMVATRKADFIKLFEERGAPLARHELECFSNGDLVDYALDIRHAILMQNRHVLFCRKCVSAVMSTRLQIQHQPEGGGAIC